MLTSNLKLRISTKDLEIGICPCYQCKRNSIVRFYLHESILRLATVNGLSAYASIFTKSFSAYIM